MKSSEKEIPDSIQNYYRAFNEKSGEKQTGFLHDKFRFITYKGKVKSKKSFVDAILKDEWNGTGFKIYEEKIFTSAEGSMSVISYNIEFYGLIENKAVKVEAVETAVLVKSDIGWKLILSHASNKYN